MNIYNKVLICALIMINILIYVLKLEHNIVLIETILFHTIGTLIVIMFHFFCLKFNNEEK